MARKIAIEAARALRNRKSYCNRNTKVVAGHLFLHGNLILTLGENSAKITLAGWNTVTTRSRLNDVCRELGILFWCWQKDYRLNVSYKDAETNSWEERVAHPRDVFNVRYIRKNNNESHPNRSKLNLDLHDPTSRT